MKTVQCTYTMNPTALDKFYTFKTADDVKVGDVVQTLDKRKNEVVKVLVQVVDKEYNVKAETRFGELAQVYLEHPSLPDPSATPKARRL